MILRFPLLRQALQLLALLLFASLTMRAQVNRRPGSPPSVVQQQPQLPESMALRIEADQVTAEVRNAPLHKVLEEIASRTGVIFEISTELNPLVSISLFRVGLQESIQRIVAAGDSIFYFDRDAAGLQKIKLVRIFPRGMKGRSGGLVFIGTGVPTITGLDAIESPEQALKALSESPEIETKEKAIEVLVAAKGEVAVQALMKALSDPAPEILVAAIDGLAHMGARASLPQILSALNHDHPGVRQSAVEAVALLGSSQNIKDLRPLSQDKDAAVASAAEMAIRKLSSESTRQP
jgi:hypothetical protein